MPQQITLRLGICGCTTHFHGRFETQTITVHDTILRIQEVMIPEDDEKNQEKSIRDSRIHFFLDLHHENKEAKTALFRMELIPRGKDKKEKMCFGSHNPHKAWSNHRSWTSKKPTPKKQILNAIRKILADMNANEFQRWRARMA